MAVVGMLCMSVGTEGLNHEGWNGWDMQHI